MVASFLCMTHFVHKEKAIPEQSRVRLRAFQLYKLLFGENGEQVEENELYYSQYGSIFQNNFPNTTGGKSKIAVFGEKSIDHDHILIFP